MNFSLFHMNHLILEVGATTLRMTNLISSEMCQWIENDVVFDASDIIGKLKGQGHLAQA